jgi:SSS family transporter
VRLQASTALVLAAYLAGITAFGSWLGRRDRSLKGYLLASRRIPWWAVAACIVATETSTLTFVGVPAMAYGGSWTFLQLAFGYVLGRALVATLLVPAYFQGDLYTSYELLGLRFGRGVRTASAAIFIAYRTLADGIRLHAVALVVSVATGVPEWLPILLLGSAMIVYTEEGGVVATIWTDVVQLAVYLAGGVACFAWLASRVPGGAWSALADAASRGHLRIVDLSTDLNEPYTLWAGLLGGLFLSLATHGTDQYIAQRFLVAKGPRAASVGLVVSGLFVVLQFAFFLALGTLLAAHYGGRAFSRSDEVLPTFVSTELPTALEGLVLAAMVAAALSPSLNSIAATSVRDFYVPYVRPRASEATQLRLSRALTAVWGATQMAVALLAQGVDSSLNAGLAALGYASGPTVGAFLLAVLSRRATSGGTLVGMALGLGLALAVGPLAPLLLGRPSVAWTWNVATGALATLLVGQLASRHAVRRPATTGDQ